jgi:hypothetical protein
MTKKHQNSQNDRTLIAGKSYYKTSWIQLWHYSTNVVFPGQGIVYNQPSEFCVSGIRDVMAIIANINIIIKISCSES